MKRRQLMIIHRPGFLFSKARQALATFIAGASSTANLTTYDFSVDLGSVGQYSHIFIAAAGRTAGTCTVSSLSVAGNAASERVNLGGASQNCVAIWSIAYSAGGTQTISVTFSAAMVRAGIVVWGVTGLQSETPIDTATASDTDPTTAAIDCGANGFILVGAITEAQTTTTPVGVDEDADFVVEEGANDITIFGGHLNTTVIQTALSVGCDFASAGGAERMVAGAWR